MQILTKADIDLLLSRNGGTHLLPSINVNKGEVDTTKHIKILATPLKNDAMIEQSLQISPAKKYQGKKGDILVYNTYTEDYYIVLKEVWQEYM